MLTLLILAPVFAVILVVHLIKRVLFGSYGFRHHRHFGDGDYNPYFGGFPRHRVFGGGFLPILLLVALDRLFTNRRP